MKKYRILVGYEDSRMGPSNFVVQIEATHIRVAIGRGLGRRRRDEPAPGTAGGSRVGQKKRGGAK